MNEKDADDEVINRIPYPKVPASGVGKKLVSVEHTLSASTLVPKKKVARDDCRSVEIVS